MYWKELSSNFLYGLLCCKLSLADGQPKIFIMHVDYSPFEAVDIYKIIGMEIVNEKGRWVTLYMNVK